jgi:hypothetical protein
MFEIYFCLGEDYENKSQGIEHVAGCGDVCGGDHRVYN